MIPLNEPRNPREPVAADGAGFDLVVLVLLAAFAVFALAQVDVFRSDVQSVAEVRSEVATPIKASRPGGTR